MFRFIIFTMLTTVLVSCAGSKPQKTEPQQTDMRQTVVVVRDTVHRSDTLKVTDSVFVKETESFRALQKSIDSLIARKETDRAVELLKKQVQYYNNLDQLGFRTLQLANLLHQTGRSAEGLAILESFAVYKPSINFWIDSANVLYDNITKTRKIEAMQQIDPEKQEAISSLTSQIRNLKNTNKNSDLIIDLADSLRSLAPGDSVLAWLEKQLPSATKNSDSFCEEQRKFAAEKFAASRNNKQKKNALIAEAIEALDKCLARTPSTDMKKKVMQNREVLSKELNN